MHSQAEVHIKKHTYVDCGGENTFSQQHMVQIDSMIRDWRSSFRSLLLYLPLPAGILKGLERALGTSPHLDAHIGLTSEFTFGGQVWACRFCLGYTMGEVALSFFLSSDTSLMKATHCVPEKYPQRQAHMCMYLLRRFIDSEREVWSWYHNTKPLGQHFLF